MFQIGDYIELVKMPDDPSPVPEGTRGIITAVHEVTDFIQYSVHWENGRTLHAVVPPDELRLIDDPTD